MSLGTSRVCYPLVSVSTFISNPLHRTRRHVNVVGSCRHMQTTRGTRTVKIPSFGKRNHVSSSSSSTESLSSQAVKSHRNPKPQENYGAHSTRSRSRIGIVPKISALTTAVTFGYSIHTRKWREDHLIDVPLADDSDFFFGDPEHDHNNASTNNTNRKKRKLKRNLHVLSSIIERNGLMGKSQTVKEELNSIRLWHQEHGYKGGIVLRELSVPLFDPQSDDDDDGDGSTKEESIQPHEMKQRECYYLYYEIKPNGETLHQIFCRGTTISEDVYTCLQSKLVFDEELGIHVHSGFKDHANRLVKDVLPLLGPPHTLRSTVEVSGHSLGGAVAFLVAMKLKKMGYNVEKVTAVAGARFCDPNDVPSANALLPKDSLRIEDDMDGVPFLPPWASGVGDKLWLVNKSSSSASTEASAPLYTPKYVSREALSGDDSQDQQLSWVDDWWTNIRIPEIAKVINTTHRISSHREKLQKLIEHRNTNEKDQHKIEP